MACARFNPEESGLRLGGKNVVRVIEITKLVEEKRGGGFSVDVESFEGNNLIFKFKNWSVHRTTPAKKGSPVTEEEKRERAEDIAKLLGANKIWHSHGRLIGIMTLTNVLKLEIEDYSSDTVLRGLIRNYNDLICEYIIKNGFKTFLHSRNFF